MPLTIDLQNDDALEGLPSLSQFEQWVIASLQQPYANLEQTIRIVDTGESRELNHRFRGKDRPTNVLAFSSDTDYLDYQCLGDLVVCAPVVAEEASAQGKTEQAHWAHLVVHGMLHLQGFEHENDAETARMEALEIKILDSLGYANPYNEADHSKQ